MFHIELRKFPHNTHAFNLTEPQLRATVIAPWLRNEVIEVAEQKWVPALTELTIVEGPELTNADLSLGRGWSVARRRGRDVTREMLEPAAAAPVVAAAPAASGAPEALGDLARELLAMCADDVVSAHEAWRLASSWHPGWRASDRLVAAEGAVRALLLGGYAQLCRGTRATATGNVVPGPDMEALLLGTETWSDDSGSSVFIAATDLGRIELAASAAGDDA
jgi:hypothetical protein